MTAARDAARRRHPSARWPLDVGRMQARIAADLAAAGHPWPARAAALLATRGRLGLDRAAFAELLEVPENAVAAMEEGVTDDRNWFEI
ncbi:MAG TPA: hypothetical protein VFJ85_03770 [Acidimicrobiales bacterium]|nr:hypothetical protein [Acidimicrobiales bacterium]